MSLTRKQEEALVQAKEWWNGTDKYFKPFIIYGKAGTGKTYLVKHIIESLDNLDPIKNVKYVSFTGKAVNRLVQAGNLNSITLHKFIYDFDYREEKITDEDGKVLKVENKFIKTLKPSLESEIKLVIVDECRMVEEELFNDLLSFNVPIICLGDPNQLKPISGKISSILDKPNIVLDEIMRQEKDNPIIYLAEQALNHRYIRFGNYGNCRCVGKRFIPIDELERADQILTDKNDLVNKLNQFYRKKFKNIENPFPQDGEKLICIQNNWETSITEGIYTQNLVNGLIGFSSNVKDENHKLSMFKMNFKPDYFENKCFDLIDVDSILFKDPEINNVSDIYKKYSVYGKTLNKRNIYYDDLFSEYGVRRRINFFNFAYCITVHKSQGSEFDNLVYFDQCMNNGEYFNRLYTAITRAKERIVIIKNL